MAAFEAEGEDRENNLCDEPSEDLEIDNSDLELEEVDNEPDEPRARQRFIQARRVRVTMPAWTSPNGHLVPERVEYRHNGARDHEEGLWLRLPAGAPAMGKARRR